MRALISQGKEFSVHTANHDRNATNLNPLDRTFSKLFAKKRRIPVVDKTPFGIFVRLVETLCARVIGALVADAVDPVFAPALGWRDCLVHGCTPFLMPCIGPLVFSSSFNETGLKKKCWHPRGRLGQLRFDWRSILFDSLFQTPP